MKRLGIMAALSIAVIGWAGMAAADPWEEGGKRRWRGGYERDDDGWRDRGYGYYRERRANKEEYRHGGCKIKRKWDGDEYREKVKCKRGWSSPAYGYYRY